MQWMQVPSQSNLDNLNEVKRGVSRHLRNKKREGISDRKLKKCEQNKTKKNCSFIQLGSKRMVCMIQKILRMFAF
jgi:hypothetical protein